MQKLEKSLNWPWWKILTQFVTLVAISLVEPKILQRYICHHHSTQRHRWREKKRALNLYFCNVLCHPSVKNRTRNTIIRQSEAGTEASYQKNNHNFQLSNHWHQHQRTTLVPVQTALQQTSGIFLCEFSNQATNKLSLPLIYINLVYFRLLNRNSFNSLILKRTSRRVAHLGSFYIPHFFSLLFAHTLLQILFQIWQHYVFYSHSIAILQLLNC